MARRSLSLLSSPQWPWVVGIACRLTLPLSLQRVAGGLSVTPCPPPPFSVSRVAGLEPAQLFDVLQETFPDGVPEPLQDRLRELAGSFLAGAAAGQLPNLADIETRWVGFTPNSSFVRDLMEDVGARLGGDVLVEGLCGQSGSLHNVGMGTGHC